MSTVNLKTLLSTLVNCEDAENRVAIASELCQALALTIDKVAKEKDIDERRVLIDHFEVEAGSAASRIGEAVSTRAIDANKTTVFYPFVVPPDMKAIDPRDTLARKLCGSRSNDFFFTIYFRHQVAAAVILTLAVAGGICLLLGLTGLVQSEVSWGSFLLVPFLVCFYAMLNMHLLLVLRKEFEFWVLFILSSTSCGCFLDMLWDDPQRLIAVCFLYACSLALVTSDARPAFRKKAYGYRLVFFGATLIYAFILVLYHANLWENFRNTVYHIGIGRGIEFHVPSTGMGCAMTLCVLNAKYAWVMMRSVDINPMIVIRAAIVLRPFAKGLRPTPAQAPHAMLRRNSLPVENLPSEYDLNKIAGKQDTESKGRMVVRVVGDDEEEDVEKRPHDI